MEEVIKNFGAQEEHRKYDSCFILIFTHGEENDLLCGAEGTNTSDGNNTVSMQDLLASIGAKNAPFLEGKPKIFFMLAKHTLLRFRIRSLH